jgi:hypothetical protein
MTTYLNRPATIADLICISLGFPAAMLSALVFGLPIMHNTLLKFHKILESGGARLPRVSEFYFQTGYPLHLTYAIAAVGLIAFAFHTRNPGLKVAITVSVNVATVFLVIWAALAVYYPYLEIQCMPRSSG